MKGYIVCVYESINDKILLKEYATKATQAVQKYNGNFLIKGGKNITTEGQNFVRTTVIEFSSFDAAKKFFYSKDYQDAHKLLKETVIRNHQIIEGTQYWIGSGSILLHKYHVATEQYGVNFFLSELTNLSGGKYFFL